MISWKAWKNVSINLFNFALFVLFRENGFVILIIKEMEKLFDYTGNHSSSKYLLSTHLCLGTRVPMVCPTAIDATLQEMRLVGGKETQIIRIIVNSIKYMKRRYSEL